MKNYLNQKLKNNVYVVHMIKMAKKGKPTRYWSKFEEGALGSWTKSMSENKRLVILKKLVKRDSYATIIRRLNQLRNVTKDEPTKKKAAKDMANLKKIYRS